AAWFATASASRPTRSTADTAPPSVGRMSWPTAWRATGPRSRPTARASAEREAIRLGACVEELDLEASLPDAPGLADQLVEALFGQGADALLVEVEPVGGARRLPVEKHAEPERCPRPRRPHHEIDVARLELERDAPTRL